MKDALKYLSEIIKTVFAAKWKAYTFILASVLVFSGMIVWKEQDFLLRVLFNDPLSYELDVKTFAANAPALILSNDANIIVLWEVNLDRNSRTSRVVQTLKFGRVAQLENQTSPVFTNEAGENDFILKLLNGEVVCGDLITTSVVGKTMRMHDVKFLCRAPIITSSGLMIGYVTFGYKKIPSDEELKDVRQSMRGVTKALVISSTKK
jgi:hypothetical protein